MNFISKDTIKIRKYYCNLDSALLEPDVVTELILRDIELKQFPEKIFLLRNLEILDLSLNQIEFIPNNINQLKNLRDLSLSSNRLNKISVEIGNLRKLESISFLHNNIDSIPDEICELKMLKYLNLSGNQIPVLPDCICEMNNLKMIGISYKSGMNHIKELQYLELIKCLPKTAIFYKNMDRWEQR